MIPYSHQSIDETDLEAVTNVLRGEWLTQGPHIEEFENSLASYTQAKFAVAFANGTAALHAAAAVAGLGPGDTVITSPLSFVASANCGRYVGASVNFADIDPKTLNLDPGTLPECDGLIAVHFAGLPLDLSRLQFQPRVIIEDAAHALGAITPDGPVGNCAHSHMCVFSFHPVKTITTGEGGAVTTNSEEFAEGLRRFRNHGIVRKPEEGGWFYEVATAGFNMRITDLQAALGTNQLKRADSFVARRNHLAEKYRDLLSGTGLVLPPGAQAGWVHARHLYPVQAPHRREVYDGLRNKGIGAQVHYIPIYRHPLYREGNDPSRFPHTEAAYARLLSLPLFPDMTDEQQRYVGDALISLLK
ncbi:MAG: DegT/DnrJ/EryC1/StrS family aminotransferase [Actinobacteria bacterium]|nr:DegT/DnrJ/EryC1/StrS family aminotransferase [Actinomycetota bacterium]